MRGRSQRRAEASSQDRRGPETNAPKSAKQKGDRAAFTDRLRHFMHEHRATFEKAWLELGRGRDKAYGITKGAYQQRIRRIRLREASPPAHGRVHGNAIFTEDQELVIVGMCLGLADLHLPATTPVVQHMATRVAECLGIELPAGHASEAWVRRFVHRHRTLLSFRKCSALPTKTRKRNIMDMVGAFEKVWPRHLQELGNGPDRIINADEAPLRGLSTFANKLRVCRPGSDAPYFRAPKAGKHVTVLPFVSAAGEVVAIFYILAGRLAADGKLEVPVHMKHPDHSASAQGSRRTRGRWPRYYCASKTGYVTTEMWRNIVAKVIRLYRRDGPKPDPSFLMDQYAAHVNLDTVDFMLEQRTHPVFLPANTTHHLQPLDNGLFASFDRALARAAQAHVGMLGEWKRPFSELLVQLAPSVEADVFTPEAIMGAFERTGISPWRQEVFHERARHGCARRVNSGPHEARAIAAAERVVLRAADHAEGVNRVERRKLRVDEGEAAYPVLGSTMRANARASEAEQARKREQRRQAVQQRKQQRLEERARRAEEKRQKDARDEEERKRRCQFGHSHPDTFCGEPIWFDDDTYEPGAAWCEHCNAFGYCADHMRTKGQYMDQHERSCKARQGKTRRSPSKRRRRKKKKRSSSSAQ